MAYVVPLGIPHSRFRAWDKDDQDKALAFRRWRAETCHQCGTRIEEWDPKRGGHFDAYVAETERCFGCQTIADKQEEFEKGQGNLKGLRIFLVPNPEPTPEGYDEDD